MAADRKANVTECIVMGFSRKRPGQNGGCFESFFGGSSCGQVTLTGKNDEKSNLQGLVRASQ